MFKSKVMLEVTIQEKTFQLYLDTDASLGAVHDALVQMKGEIVEQIKKVQEAENPKKE